MSASDPALGLPRPCKTVLYYPQPSGASPERCEVISIDTTTTPHTYRFFRDILAYRWATAAVYSTSPAAGECGPDLSNPWNSYQDELDTAQADRQAILAERTNFTATLAARDASIAGLSQTVVTKDSAISVLTQTVAARDAAIASVNQTVATRDASITTLTAARDAALSTVTTRDGQISALNGQISSLQGQAASLTSALATRTTERDTALGTVSARDATISTLNGQNSVLTASLATRTAERDTALSAKAASDAALVLAQARALRPISGYTRRVWTWNGGLPTGSSAADVAAGKPTSLQHDPAWPGLSVLTEGTDKVLRCTVGSAQALVNGNTHRAEMLLSATGSAGDLYEGHISTQEFMIRWPTNWDFDLAGGKRWGVAGQTHQDLNLGNGGPPVSMEMHGDNYRLRVMNGYWDKAYARGRTTNPDAGVYWQSAISALGLGSWVKVKMQFLNSLSWEAGWVSLWINDVQVVNRQPTATMDFDGDPAAPYDGVQPTFGASRNYPKVGLYQHPSIVGPRVLDFKLITFSADVPNYLA